LLLGRIELVGGILPLGEGVDRQDGLGVFWCRRRIDD
jgi:hypothetical protein